MDKCRWINGVYIPCSSAKKKFEMDDSGQPVDIETGNPVDFPVCPYCQSRWAKPADISVGDLCQIGNFNRWETVKVINQENGTARMDSGQSFQLTSLTPGCPTGFDSGGKAKS